LYFYFGPLGTDCLRQLTGLTIGDAILRIAQSSRSEPNRHRVDIFKCQCMWFHEQPLEGAKWPGKNKISRILTSLKSPK